MIAIGATTDSIDAIIANDGTATETELSWTCVYVDVEASSGAGTFGVSRGNATTSSGTATVTLVAAPAAGHTRTAQHITFAGLDAHLRSVVVRLNDGTDIYTVFSAVEAFPLQFGALEYVNEAGWRAYAPNGALVAPAAVTSLGYVSDAPAAGSHANYAPSGFGAATTFLDVDCSAGAVTIDTLSAASAFSGQTVIIRKSDSSANALTLGNANAQGQASLVLPVQYAAHRLTFYGGAINKWCIT